MPMLTNRRFSNTLSLTLTSTIFLALTSSAFACQPLNDGDFSSEAVINRFNSVDTVVIAKLIRSQKVGVKGTLNDFELPGEQNTFRTVRVFKGSIKPGDRFTLTTTLSGCGRSAVNDPPWLYSANGRPKKKVDAEWLIYRNVSENTQITNSNYTKMLSTATSDVEILNALLKSKANLNQN
jgi:hypothetical protein